MYDVIYEVSGSREIGGILEEAGYLILMLSWEVAVGVGVIGGCCDVFGVDFERVEESIVYCSVVSGHSESTSGDDDIVSS